MDDFTPIDHKDSDLEYRNEVRGFVEQAVGSKLVDITSEEELIGDWERTCPYLPDHDSQRFSYLFDGTFRSPYDADDTPRSKWKVERGTFTEITWCKPMPEFGIAEGTWNYETLHCAVTDTGSVAIWNGDGSLLLLLTKCV